MLGVTVSITSPARTVIECSRYRKKVGCDVALESRKDALQQRHTTVSELTRVAKACRISTVIKPYLEAVLA